MKLLDCLKIRHGSEEKLIEIYQGDLTDLAPCEAVDVLIVSAFPGDYSPTPNSLIGALYRKGISVAQLAAHKYADLRVDFSCWMSQEIARQHPGIQFNRILCFEPLVRGEPTEVVGDIFRSLAPFLSGDLPITTAAMPLVACGDQWVPVRKMITPLLDAAVHWMALGFPLRVLRIVEISEPRARELKEEFLLLKDRYREVALGESSINDYDVFVSYSHIDDIVVSLVVEELKTLRPRMRIFFDRMSLDTGVAWQQKIYEAIDASRQFVAMFSPDYLRSKVCLEEFNIALHRRRDTNEELLFPIYLYSANLPTYMKALVNYEDCREGDAGKLRLSCEKLLSRLEPTIDPLK